MIPVSGLPYTGALFDALVHTREFLDRCRTPDEFFRDIADRNVSDETIADLDRLLFGYLAFDYQQNYPLYRILSERVNEFNSAMGRSFNLWTMLSKYQRGTVNLANTEEYRLWNKENDYFTPIFTAACMEQLGVQLGEKPVLILSKSLKSTELIVAELDYADGDRVLRLFKNISTRVSACREVSLNERARALVKVLKDDHVVFHTQNIRGGLSFAGALASVYETFLRDERFEKELHGYY